MLKKVCKTKSIRIKKNSEKKTRRQMENLKRVSNRKVSYPEVVGRSEDKWEEECVCERCGESGGGTWLVC